MKTRNQIWANIKIITTGLLNSELPASVCSEYNHLLFNPASVDCTYVYACLVAYECFLFGKLKPPPIQEDSAHHQIFIRMEIMPVMMTEHMQTKCAKFV